MRVVPVFCSLWPPTPVLGHSDHARPAVFPPRNCLYIVKLAETAKILHLFKAGRHSGQFRPHPESPRPAARLLLYAGLMMFAARPVAGRVQCLAFGGGLGLPPLLAKPSPAGSRRHAGGSSTRWATPSTRRSRRHAGQTQHPPARTRRFCRQREGSLMKPRPESR